MSDRGQELPDVIIFGNLITMLVPVYFDRHRSGYVVCIRHAYHAEIGPASGNHFGFTLQNLQAVLNQFCHSDCTQMSRSREQIPVDVMVERFGAERVEIQLVDQIQNCVRKFFLAIPDKLGQADFRLRPGRRAKIIREIQVNAIDRRQLFIGHNRQFWQ